MEEWIWIIKKYRIPKGTIKLTTVKAESRGEQWIYHCKQIKPKT